MERTIQSIGGRPSYATGATKLRQNSACAVGQSVPRLTTILIQRLRYGQVGVRCRSVCPQTDKLTRGQTAKAGRAKLLLSRLSGGRSSC